MWVGTPPRPPNKGANRKTKMPYSKQRNRKCKQCGKQYELGNESSLHKYCSISCRQKWHYNKWKSSGASRDKEKTHKYWIKHTYKISYEEYEKLVIKYNGKCGICNKPDVAGFRLAVDHNHTTGKVRGLLCSKCNRAIGLFDDNVKTILKAAEYLNENDK